MSTKTISMTCRDSNGGTVTITQDFDYACSWPAIAYQFACFLRGMGYLPDTEDVGGDVESFVKSTDKSKGVF